MNCDELKAMTVFDAYQLYCNDNDLVYLKSEADKVIAELEENHNKEVGQLLIKITELKSEIERLENLCAIYRQDCDNLAISNEQVKIVASTLLKKMNHNKRKRCLAMAMKCETQCYYFNERFEHRKLVDNVKWQLFDRWRLKWSKLADKFKEAK